MFAILKTNDPVILNFAEVLLRDAGIHAIVFDREMSNMDGNLGILPRRLMVADEDVDRARTVLGAGMGDAQLVP
jgi:hypothetical protein